MDNESLSITVENENKEEKPYAHYDPSLGKILSDKKYEEDESELIIPKELRKGFVFEDGNMPIKRGDEFYKKTFSTQVELKKRFKIFKHLFNKWVSYNKEYVFIDGWFETVFEEQNSSAFFGLNFDTNRHFEIKSTVYDKDTETYDSKYPSFRLGKLLFYKDEYETDQDRKFKAMFIIEEKISSLVHNDTSYHHTIAMKRTLTDKEEMEDYYDNFFINIMYFIKGGILHIDDEVVETINKANSMVKLEK